MNPSAAELGSIAPDTRLRERRERQRAGLSSAAEWVIVLAGALGVALLIKTFVLQAFYIPSESMLPTLQVRDRVLVNKLSYRMHDVNRGDVLVFQRPPSESDQKVKDLIKRVIALPGEKVEAHDGQVYINGQALKEPYLPGTPTSDFAPHTVEPDSLWVMGDNRGNSKDSRVFGSIPRDRVVGRAFIRLWPFNAIHLL